MNLQPTPKRSLKEMCCSGGEAEDEAFQGIGGGRVAEGMDPPAKFHMHGGRPLPSIDDLERMTPAERVQEMGEDLAGEWAENEPPDKFDEDGFLILSDVEQSDHGS